MRVRPLPEAAPLSLPPPARRLPGSGSPTRCVIAPDSSLVATPPRAAAQAVQDALDPASGQTSIDFEGEVFPRQDVDHAEQPDDLSSDLNPHFVADHRPFPFGPHRVPLTVTKHVWELLHTMKCTQYPVRSYDPQRQ